MTEQTAPQTAPKPWHETPWWVEKYLCSTVDAKDPKPGEPKRIAVIYKAIGIEAGRIVGLYVIHDGTMTNEVQPLRFFPVESLLASTYDNKPGTRVFTSYAAAASYAESVGAMTAEKAMGLTTERLDEIKGQIAGGKSAHLKFGTATEETA